LLVFDFVLTGRDFALSPFTSLWALSLLAVPSFPGADSLSPSVFSDGRNTTFFFYRDIQTAALILSSFIFFPQSS